MTRLWPDGDPITVVVDEDAMPRSFVWHDRAHPVAQIEEHWRISTDWWSEEGEVSRECFRLVTRTGLLCEIFFDVLAQGWRLARVYD